MKTIIEYTVNLNSPIKNGSILIDKKAIEEGHTDNKLIYCMSGFDSVFKDSQGNDVTSGYRLTADKKNNVLITIVNSYFKDERNKASKLLYINND
jgi:hypothetical protein